MEGSDVNLPAVSWANITALYQLLSTYPDPPLSLTPPLSISHLDGLLWVAQIAHEDVPAPHAELPAVGAHLRHAGAGPADMGQTVHTVTLENM